MKVWKGRGVRSWETRKGNLKMTISQKKLTDTQAILTYVATLCGTYEAVERAAEHERAVDEKPSIWKMAKICRDYKNYLKTGFGSFDRINEMFSEEDIAFVRNALKGGRYGNRHNILIGAIFGYSANI